VSLNKQSALRLERV